ncbi:MAG: ABC-2 transporter permease [Lachnospiraceae bacterium]|nr:ABC-2 transporter permease [Lachnospiraceae bacterium]
MRGLIYKDVIIFFKGIDKKMILLVVGVNILLMFNTGVYAGLFATVMLAMSIGMQNIMCFANDERADWKTYQMAMPVDTVSVVASRYVSVILTLTVSLAGSMLFNLVSGVASGCFDGALWGISAAVAILLPLLWTGICLPLTYWFGFRSAQTMGMFAVIPMFLFIKYFEDGVGFSAMISSLSSALFIAGVVTVVVFCLSMGISAAGYARKG